MTGEDQKMHTLDMVRLLACAALVAFPLLAPTITMERQPRLRHHPRHGR
jgi:hypothetical protein